MTPMLSIYNLRVKTTNIITLMFTHLLNNYTNHLTICQLGVDKLLYDYYQKIGFTLINKKGMSKLIKWIFLFTFIDFARFIRSNMTSQS